MCLRACVCVCAQDQEALLLVLDEAMKKRKVRRRTGHYKCFSISLSRVFVPFGKALRVCVRMLVLAQHVGFLRSGAKCIHLRWHAFAPRLNADIDLVTDTDFLKLDQRHPRSDSKALHIPITDVYSVTFIGEKWCSSPLLETKRRGSKECFACPLALYILCACVHVCK